MSYSEYQRAAILQVCRAFQGQDAYLVADEVGLGKTFVARGVIESLREKKEGTSPFRVIYVASNQEIARANAPKLGQLISQAERGGWPVFFDRLSMMGGDDIQLPDAPPIQIYALSPNTTFTGRGSPCGSAKERKRLIAGMEDKWRRKGKLAGEAALVAALEDYDDPKAVRERAAPGAEKAIRVLRREMNDQAVRKLDPDLVILDEFHRFSSILAEEEREGEYSFRRMLRVLNEERRGRGAPPVKLLLLSATPYQYDHTAGEEVHHYGGETAADLEPDATEPFRDFLQLKEYLCGLNGIEPSEVADTVEDYARHLLCRTQRDWLCPDSARIWVEDLTTTWAGGRLTARVSADQLWAHIRSCEDFLERMTGKGPGLPEGLEGQRERDVASAVLEQGRQTAAALEAPWSVASFAHARIYLDEAPEYPQFADGYHSVQKGSKMATLEEGRRACCKLLRWADGHLLRRRGDGLDVDPDPAWYKRLQGHYKWETLKKIAMPPGCELRLWATPVGVERAGEPQCPETPYGKTVVFAHYRMSTRAVAVLTSMEAQLRLEDVCQGRLLQPLQAAPEMLLEPFRPLLKAIAAKAEKDPAGPGGETLLQGLRKLLSQAVTTFFSTTHALRVVTAHALLAGQGALPETAEAVLAYCRAYHWRAAVGEYLSCLAAFVPLEKLDAKELARIFREVQSVLGWTDRDRTRVLVLPDWADQGYPCTFGERYTSDYSDKSAHNEEDGEEGVRRNTARRLEHIRRRFQSPFYPFVLAASETAQEGVDLHSYAQTVVHWSVPSNLNAFVQEEGRVDRRGSLTIRRQLRYLAERDERQRLLLAWARRTGDLTPLFDPERAEELRGERPPAPTHAGLFPYWYLPLPEGAPGVPRLRRALLCLPLSGEVEEYARLLRGREKYASFGLRDAAGRDLPREEAEKLCPYLVSVPTPLYHGTNQYALSLTGAQRADLLRACRAVEPLIRAALPQLEAAGDASPDLVEAVEIWKAMERGSQGFAYGALYLTFARWKAEGYARASRPCGERSSCCARLLQALEERGLLPTGGSPEAFSARILLTALAESQGSPAVILRYDQLPCAQVLALEDGTPLTQKGLDRLRRGAREEDGLQDSLRVRPEALQGFDALETLP